MGFSFFRLPLCFGLGLVDEDGDGFVGHKCADLQILRGNAAMRLARQDRQPENRFPFFRLSFKPKQNPHFASSSETKCGFFSHENAFISYQQGLELPPQANICRAFIAVAPVFIHAVEVHIKVVGDLVVCADA